METAFCKRCKQQTVVFVNVLDKMGVFTKTPLVKLCEEGHFLQEVYCKHGPLKSGTVTNPSSDHFRDTKYTCKHNHYPQESRQL